MLSEFTGLETDVVIIITVYIQFTKWVKYIIDVYDDMINFPKSLEIVAT